MNLLENKRVLIFQQRGWAISIGLRLAEKLEAMGCRLAAITIKKSTQVAIENSNTKYDLIFNADEIKEDPGEYIKGCNLTLEDVCNGLGVCSIWPLVQASRYHVKSYRDKYYFGYSQNLSDKEIRQYVIAIYKYILYIFEEFSPDFIIVPNYAGLQHVMFNLYARKNNIKMLGCVDSKLPNITLLTTSYLADKGRFIERLKDLNNDSCMRMYENAERDFDNIRSLLMDPDAAPIGISGVQNKNWFNKLKDELIPFARIVLFFLRKRKNRLKNQKTTLDDQTPYYIFRDYIQGKINAWNAEKHTISSTDKLGEFVYFPLQVQPEATIDIFSARFNNQIETARQIAMSLPGDITLVVKDHPSMRNKRSTSYLKKISRLPNVVLLNPNISTEEILGKAKMVIAPGGTTIFQASILFKPVIQLGDLGTTKELPNVYHHQDLSTLCDKIKEVLEKEIDYEYTKNKLLNYISAANEVGFNLGYYDIAENHRKGSRDEVDNICERIVHEIKCYV